MATDSMIGGPWPTAVFIHVDVPIAADDVTEGNVDGTMPFVSPPTAAGGRHWNLTIDLKSGQIADWPAGARPFTVRLKVKDGGTYTLLDRERIPIVRIKQGYVPNEILPGEHGDYLWLDIGADGRLTNWYRMIDTGEFDEEFVELRFPDSGGQFADD